MVTYARTPPTAHHEDDPRLLDIATMRESALRLLVDDAEPPSPEELEIISLRLRGLIMLLIPAVEDAARNLPEDDVSKACALACIGEARIRLGLEPGRTLPAGIAHGQRLSRSVNALCDHMENLGGDHA